MAAKNFLIGGGFGQIGYYLIKHLTKAGHRVSVVSRGRGQLKFLSPAMNELPVHERITWKELEINGLPVGTDVVINLTGHTIGDPGTWSQKLRDKITESRIGPTRALARAIENAHARSEELPECFIAASAVGIYENGNSKVFTEADDPVPSGKHNFFTSLCRDWEKASQLPSEISTRVVNARFGVSLAHNTKPLDRMLISLTPIILGQGSQPFPWIHMDDAVAAICAMVEQEELSGPVNCVAPNINTNRELSRAVAEAVWLAESTPNLILPAGLVRFLYGQERADAILLDSPRVAPQKLLDSGFTFQHPELGPALQAVMDSKSDSDNRWDKALVKVVEARKAFINRSKTAE